MKVTVLDVSSLFEAFGDFIPKDGVRDRFYIFLTFILGITLYSFEIIPVIGVFTPDESS